MKSLIIWASVGAVIGAILLGSAAASFGNIFGGIWIGCGLGCSFNFLTNKKREGMSDNWSTFWLILFALGGLISFIIYFFIKKNKEKDSTEKAAEDAYLSASTRRCNQFLALDELKIQLGQIDRSNEIAYKEYKTFSNGESVNDYFQRTGLLRDLPGEVRLWYYYEQDIEKLRKLSK